MFLYKKIWKCIIKGETHLGWSSGIDLELGSVLLLKVSDLIPSGVNMSELI